MDFASYSLISLRIFVSGLNTLNTPTRLRNQNWTKSEGVLVRCWHPYGNLSKYEGSLVKIDIREWRLKINGLTSWLIRALTRFNAEEISWYFYYLVLISIVIIRAGSCNLYMISFTRFFFWYFFYNNRFFWYERYFLDHLDSFW